MKTRNLEGISKVAFRISAIAFSLLFVLHAGTGILGTVGTRGFYIMFNVVLGLMIYPVIRNKGSQKQVPWYDIVLIVLTILSFGYWILSYESYVKRVTMPNKADFWFGLIAMIILFEIARRVLGKTLVIVAAIFLLQLYFGPYLPGTFCHAGFSIKRILEFMYSSMEGIFGTITNTFSTYVLPFIIMGAFMEYSGAGNFFIQLALSYTKGWAGGPAKVSVIASGVFGSISGSSVANVVSTGTFTIPMMKRVGFTPEESGAIEAAASTGGQFLPPVMGAGAFLLASLTETPYLKVVTMGIIPALLYYYWVGCAVHYVAKKRDIGSLPEDEIPNSKEVFKSGWFFIAPLILIFVLLFMGYSANIAAFYAIICLIVLSWFTRDSKMGPKQILNALEKGARSGLSVGASIGMLGIVMGGIVLAGLGAKFAAIVVSFSRGLPFLGILLTGFVAVFIGMGATQTATYLIIAMIVVPGLQRLGVEKVVAHMIAFWFAGLSNVTPPVAVSALAGASIADADPTKTGYIGVKFSLMMFIIPFTFHYFSEMLLLGTIGETIYMVICMLIAIPAVAAGVMGYFQDNLDWGMRILISVAGIMIFRKGLITDIIGLSIIFVIFIYQKKKRKAVGA